MKKYSCTLLVLLSLLLQGCEEQVLYSQLNEHEANEIIATLYLAGLSASKIAEKGGEFRIDIEKEVFANAMSLLQSRGLPKKRYTSLGEVFAKEGFVSSPLEERARLNYALSEELSNTLASIDGVLVARVHLAFPEKQYLTDEQAASSASVFIKHRYNVDLTGSVSQIKALVVDGVENLPYENVTVGLFAAEAPSKFSPVSANTTADKWVAAGIALPEPKALLIISLLTLLGASLVLIGKRLLLK